ncbi:MAG: membrane protein insertion efficiency factor YidD [Candidatus Levybacteria bacterium]|nr:membrane protein insertion efficiency factor YidD [Candidatus Levybacteria bacterium]
MKHFFIFGITVYQQIFSNLLKTLIGTTQVCRYFPTCSEYAKQSIIKYGVIKGGYFSVKRILSCQPFSKLYV